MHYEQRPVLDVLRESKSPSRLSLADVIDESWGCECCGRRYVGPAQLFFDADACGAICNACIRSLGCASCE